MIGAAMSVNISARQRLWLARDNLGIELKEMSEKLARDYGIEVSPQYLGQIESGAKKLDKVSTGLMAAIYETLGLDHREMNLLILEEIKGGSN